MSDENTKTSSETDWERVDSLTDEEIDTSDIAPLTDSFFARAQLRLPEKSVAVTIHLDPQVFEWFKAQGDGYEDRMNAALRIYAESHKAFDG